MSCMLHAPLPPPSPLDTATPELIQCEIVPPEVEASFTTIIDSILAASDLDTISEKRIRQGLQQSVEYDITPQKV